MKKVSVATDIPAKWGLVCAADVPLKLKKKTLICHIGLEIFKNIQTRFCSHVLR